MAMIYFFLNDPGKARQILSQTKASSPKYEYLIELAQLLIESKEMAVAQQTDDASMNGLEAKYVAFVTKYPEVMEGRALLGGLQTTMGNHGDAIRNLALATRADIPTLRAGIFRNLTISLAKLDRFPEAYQAANKTFSLHKSVMSDPWFMLAVARAQAGLGDIADAETTLGVILSKRPEIERDPDYLTTVHFVAEARARPGRD
ncbi:MAG: hypothetical protein Q8Q73_10505 [Stagnimonas sp.]|nr:hypothetical protein [Stagnimonas sp.]